MKLNFKMEAILIMILVWYNFKWKLTSRIERLKANEINAKKRETDMKNESKRI